MMFKRILTAAAIIGVAAPVTAQTPYPYPQSYPQPYPQQYPPGYSYPQQGYGQNVFGQMIDQLLGNRYNMTDRTAIQRCASAAVAQATAQYRPRSAYGQPYGYNQGYGYQHGYNPAMAMRVTAITDVQRRQNGLRVSGLLDSRAGYPPYGQAYGYQNRGYAATGDLTFRCNVDYRGVVTNVRIRRNTAYRR